MTGNVRKNLESYTGVFDRTTSLSEKGLITYSRSINRINNLILFSGNILVNFLKIVSIIGARSQFIKCASVYREFKKVQTKILVYSRQHYNLEMLDVFFEELQIPKSEHHLVVEKCRIIVAIHAIGNWTNNNIALYGGTAEKIVALLMMKTI